MEIGPVDDMLINSFGMSDLANIDIEKYQNGIFSPSPTKAATMPTPSPGPTVTIASPQKSPHVVPNNYTHQQQPTPQQQPPQQQQQQQQQHTQRHPQQPRTTAQQQPRTTAQIQQFHNAQQQMPPPAMQRKIHLGPHFDRLGILNQANEVPPMSAPFFAKALQQHGGTTLGAILQAHQHALQQQMHRENFLLQQAAQHQLFQQQGFPMNQIYQQQHAQRMNPLLLERRADDQIVPNPPLLTHQEAWMQQQGLAHAQMQQVKHFRMKRDAEEAEMNISRNSHRKSKSKKARKENYVIFNDETSQASDVMISGDDEPIHPPKNSVFVRYKSDTSKPLPSFNDVFTENNDKVKKQENSCENKEKETELTFSSSDVQLSDENKSLSKEYPNGKTDPVVQGTPDKNVDGKDSRKPTKDNEETPSYSYLDFLNDVGKEQNEGEQVTDNKNKAKESPTKKEEKKEIDAATDSIGGLFANDLDLTSEHNYDNLFNGNTDEHYFQAFKENNLHLNDLNENKMGTNDDVLKLFHSPLDFLNDKFLK